MRIAIHDFSQQVASSMVDTVTYTKGNKELSKTIAIDATDLLILDWFAKFYPNMKKSIIDGKEYAWVKRSKVLEDLPILRISEASVSERLKKLVHFKLLDYRLIKENGTYCYYTFGDNYRLLIETGQPVEGIGSTQHGVSGQTDTGIKGQPDNKDSKVNNRNIKHKDIRDGKRFVPPTIEEVEAYIKEKGYSVNAERWMAYYESNGWMVGRTKMKNWKAAVRYWNSQNKNEPNEDIYDNEYAYVF